MLFLFSCFLISTKLKPMNVGGKLKTAYTKIFEFLKSGSDLNVSKAKWKGNTQLVSIVYNLNCLIHIKFYKMHILIKNKKYLNYLINY